MSVRKPWDDEARKKAIQAFRKHYPNWSVVSNYSKCPNPKCGRPNFCLSHRYAYEEWLGSVAGVPMLALKDPKLKAEFKNGILKGHCPPNHCLTPSPFRRNVLKESQREAKPLLHNQFPLPCKGGG